MSIIQAIILGIVQGATEFIPVSSSGHLIVVPKLFGWAEDQGLAFDTALHIGTLLAVFIYFKQDLKAIFIDGTRGFINRKKYRRETGLLIAIILGSIPAAIAGLFLKDIAETTFRDPYVVATTLAIVAFVMLFADKSGKKLRPMEEMRTIDWVIIGIAQAIALVPGVSRSGITISAGLFRDLKREVSARSSFLLSVPAITGAAALAVGKLIKSGFPMEQLSSFIVGTITAGIVGYLCIGFLINYLKQHNVKVFVYYRLVLGVVIVLTMYFLR